MSYTRKNHFRTDGYYKQDIEAIERVQRRFSKRLPGQKELTYEERSKFLGWPTLELRRRVHTDLLWCYKILFEMVHLTSDHFFFKLSSNQTRGRGFNLYKQFSSSAFIFLCSVCY